MNENKALTDSIRRSRFVRNPVLAGIAAFAAGIVVVGGMLLVLRSATNDPSSPVSPAVTSATATTTTTVSVESAIGGSAQGFTDVQNALDRARNLWEDNRPQEYAYRLAIECDCAEAGSSWSRVFDEDALPGTVAVETLFNRISAAIEEQPDSIEVDFSMTDGHPISYRVSTATDELTVAIEDFHPITQDPTPFDGTWRFVEGTVDGVTFKSPPNQGLYIEISRSAAQYAVDCNYASARVDIYEGSFGVLTGGITAAGCGTYSDESRWFQDGVTRSDTIATDGADLVLGGPGVELRFTPPQVPDDFGELPLTAAGERLSFEIPDGRERSVTYVITQGVDHPSGAIYLLTAETTGSTATASWQRWEGEPEEPATRVTGPGPDTVVMPDDIGVGDLGLCSPYWEPDQFCFTLRVRPPSAPWIVSAGEAGVVLHDADGTSEILSTEPARIAFYVDGKLVVQPTTGRDRVVVTDVATGMSAELLHQLDETLLDVAEFDGSIRALTTDSSGTYVVDIDTADRRRLAPPASEARFAGATIILRIGNSFSAVRTDGSMIWDRVFDAEALVTPDQNGQLRVDVFTTLNNDAGDDPYFQYVESEFVDLATGETVDSYEWEVAIPFEGHQIGEQCVRSEIKDGLLLCPQPDGRIVTLPTGAGGAGSGDSHTLTSGATTATFSRP